MIASVGTAVSLPVPASGLNFVGEGFHVLFVLVESSVFGQAYGRLIAVERLNLRLQLAAETKRSGS